MKKVIGYVTSDITVLIECPYCGRAHTHGRGKPNAIGNLGHRASHCCQGGDNPGYEIIEVKPLAEWDVRKFREKAWRCPLPRGAR